MHLGLLLPQMLSVSIVMKVFLYVVTVSLLLQFISNYNYCNTQHLCGTSLEYTCGNMSAYLKYVLCIAWNHLLNLFHVRIVCRVANKSTTSLLFFVVMEFLKRHNRHNGLLSDWLITDLLLGSYGETGVMDFGRSSPSPFICSRKTWHTLQQNIWR